MQLIGSDSSMVILRRLLRRLGCSSTRLFIIGAIPIILGVINFAVLGTASTITRNDARLINESGVVRGSIQRIVKLELNGQSAQMLIAETDALLTRLTRSARNDWFAGGSRSLAVRYRDLRQDWQVMRDQLQRYRSAPNDTLRATLLRQSEFLWQRADGIVTLAQTISESKRVYLILALCVIIIDLLVLAWMIYLVKRYVRDQLEFTAYHDSLTGVFNRHTYDATVPYKIDLAARHDWPFSLIMVDVDLLKQVNDRFGHQAGDRVLRAVADQIRSSLRSSDTCYRVGGDEFVIVLENTSEAGARTLARKIRTGVRRHMDEQIEHLSVSTGVVCARSGESHEALFRRADEAMYKDKSNRRHDQTGMNPAPAIRPKQAH